MQNQADDQIFLRFDYAGGPQASPCNCKAAKMRGARLARPAIVLPLGPLNLRDAPLLARREPRLTLDATFVTKIGERFLGLEAVVRVGINLVAIDEELHALIAVLGSCRPGAHDNASDKRDRHAGLYKHLDVPVFVDGRAGSAAHYLYAS
jgi:hypothetical protein